MEDKNAFLGKEPIGKLLFKLSVPTLAAQIINMLYNIVDRIYIGRMPGDGDLALTGIGVCLPIIMVVSAFACLVGSGGAPRASIFLGQKDHESAEKTLGTCFAMQIIISIVLTTILLIWNRDLLMIFGSSEKTIGYAEAYMNIYAIGTIFVQLTLGMNAFITAQGFAKTGMFTVLIGAVLNIVLDPIFIYVLHMGVRGAALATIISQCVSCIWAVGFLMSKRSALRILPKNIRLNFKLLIPCLTLGMATFVMQASESAIIVCFNSSLQRYGGDLAVGSMTILSSVLQFAMLPLQGFGQGAQPISSYNYGAGNAKRVKKTFHLLLTVSMIYSVTLWALVMLFPGTFAAAFSDKPELIAYTETTLRIYCAALVLFGAQTACQLTFVSLGSAKSSILVAVVRKFVLLLPLIYLMPHLMADKALAVFTAEPVADVLAVSFTVILFTFQFRKSMKMLEQRNQNSPASLA